MIEHRLIEKMLKLAEMEISRISESNSVDPVFVDVLVDFMRTYADRTHHGKEEDILFNELESRHLTGPDRMMKEELVHEHILARQKGGELIEANRAYLDRVPRAMGTIQEKLTFFTDFYPKHIQKEDREFFPASEKYFTSQELNRMVNAFWEFDRKMIHEKYQKLFDSLSYKIQQRNFSLKAGK